MIYLITNCTNVKKIPTNDNLLLRNYRSNTLESISFTWNENIKNTENNQFIEARNLYAGVSWKAILEAEKNFALINDTRLLISSAGYGLIESDKKITSYGITFANGHEDSIRNFKSLKDKNITSFWWNLINKFNIKSLDHPIIFIAVSYEYLIAMQNTINALIENFSTNVFIVVLSQKKLPSSYEKNILRFDSRFNSYEKGTVSTAIPRFIKWLSKEITRKNLALDHCTLQNYINSFFEKYEEYIMPIRNNLSDNEILKCIEIQIKEKEINNKTKGLRNLRSMGYACGQDRYNKLFKKIMKEDL